MQALSAGTEVLSCMYCVGVGMWTLHWLKGELNVRIESFRRHLQLLPGVFDAYAA